MLGVTDMEKMDIGIKNVIGLPVVVIILIVIICVICMFLIKHK